MVVSRAERHISWWTDGNERLTTMVATERMNVGRRDIARRGGGQRKGLAAIERAGVWLRRRLISDA